MADNAPPPYIGTRQRAIIATVVVVAVIGFMALTHALAIRPTYAGLLFFWFWGAIGDAKFPVLPAMLIGALVGVAIAWGLQRAAAAHNAPALAALVIVIIAAIYVQIMQLVPIAINAATMLFLTVAGAPLLQEHEDLGLFTASIMLSAVYFGAIVFLFTRLTAGRDPAPGADAGAA